MKRILFFSAALMLLIGFTGAASIDAPSTIPQNVSWGFSVNIGSGSTATVDIDGSKVAEVFSSGDVIYKAFSPRVSNAYMFGNELVVYHVGLSEGDHIISVDSSDGSDSKDIASVALPNSADILADVDAKVNEKLEKFDEYDQKFLNQDVDNKEFWRKIQENETSISSFDEKISSLDSSVSSLSSDFDGSSSKQQSLESRVASLEGIESQKLAEEEAARLAEEEAMKNSPLSGMYVLVTDLAIPLAFIVIVIVLGIVAFIAKDRLPKFDSIYSSGKDENNLPISKEDEDAVEEAMVSGSKWAYKESKETEED